jgi:uncharacterized membrane protein
VPPDPTATSLDAGEQPVVDSRLCGVKLTLLSFVSAVATAFQAPWFATTRDGRRLDWLVAAGTITCFAASLTHAASRQGWRWTLAFLAIVTGGSVMAETVSLHTGWPFGSYRYAARLGWTVLDVPILVPMAWTMMAYSALVVARRMTRHRVGGPLVAALALVAWDLVLDPVMITAGYWTWQVRGPAWLGIPVSNFVGWFGVTVSQMAALWWWPGRLFEWREGAVDDRVPLGLYAGTLGVHFVRAAVLVPPTHAAIEVIGLSAFAIGVLISARAVVHHRSAQALAGRTPASAEGCLATAP